MRAWIEDDEPSDVHFLDCAIWWTHNDGCTCTPSTADRLDAIHPQPLDENREAS